MSAQLEQLLGYLEREGVTQVVIGTGRPIAMRTPNGFTNITARPLSAEQLANFMRHPDIAALVPDTDGDGDIAEVQIGRRRAVAQVRKKGHELILSLSRSENAGAPPGTQPIARVAMPKPDADAAAPRAKSPTGARAKSSTGSRAKSPSNAPRTKSPTKIPRTKGSTYTPISTFKEAPKPPAPTALDTPTSRLPAGLTFGGAGASAASSPAASDFDSFSLDDANVELGGGGDAAVAGRAATVDARSALGAAGRDAVAGRAATVDARRADLGAQRPLDVDDLELGTGGSSLESSSRSFEGAGGRGAHAGNAGLDGAGPRRGSVDDAGVPRAGAAGGSRAPDLAGVRAARPGAGHSPGLDSSPASAAHAPDDDLGLDGPGTGTAMLGYAATRGPASRAAPSRGHSLGLDDVGSGAQDGLSLELDDVDSRGLLDDNDASAYSAAARAGSSSGISLALDDDRAYGGARAGMSLDLDDDTDAAGGDLSLELDDIGSRAPSTRPAVAQSAASFAQRASSPAAASTAATSTTRFGSPVARGASSPAIGVPSSLPPVSARASSPAIQVPATVPAEQRPSPAASPRIASGAAGRADTGAFGALLRAARERGASDLHVSAARVTAIRVGGELVPLEPGAAPMSASAVSDMLLPLLDDASQAQLEKVGYVDLALEAPGGGRLRANISRQQQGLKGTFRLALAAPASLEQLGLPAELAKVVHHHQGLIIVAGPSGQGKTTTLAAFVDLLNSTKPFHILTIEDPVEIVHPRKQAVISQREAGRHTTSFARGLKASLREDPDVIVIGELRDRDSVEIALTAAETGHLVIATMSTPSASKTIDRLIDMFPPDEQNQVRASIAGALRAIIAQRLVPKRGGGVVPAVELVTGVLPLAVLIRDDKLYQLPNLLQRGRAFGMIRMDESLLELVRSGKVDEETALAFAESKKDLAAQLRPAQAQAAQPQAKTSPLWGFGKKEKP